MRRLVGIRPIILASVALVVINRYGKILFQLRTDSLNWGLIGGAIELAESAEEAAERELFEETGLKAASLKFVTVLSGKDLHYIYPNGDEIYNVPIVYEVNEYIGKLSINDDEGLKLRFFDLTKPEIAIQEMTKNILRKTGYVTW